jgi:hypothetical protein
MNSEITIDEGTKLSIAAAQILEDLKYGRQRVKFGENKAVVIKESKLINKKIIISFAAILSLFFYSAIEFSKPSITGFITNNRFDSKRKKLDNSKVLFYSHEDDSVYTCYTNAEGDFSIRLPKGEYSVSAVVNDKEIKSTMKLKCVESDGFRVCVPY